MYLMRIDLSYSDPRVRRALADCQRMHRFVTSLFDTQRQESDILYRLRPMGSQVRLYIYANRPLKEGVAVESVSKDVSSWLQSMEAGQIKGFDLLVSPSKKVPGAGRNSQRRVLRTFQERKAWLERKAEQNGFRILAADEQEQTHIAGNREESGKMVLDAYHYQGTLKITDAERFRAALSGGIGPGKAYGLGMLLLM